MESGNSELGAQHADDASLSEDIVWLAADAAYWPPCSESC